ncbi:MAG TPA: TetR/AcrR family transcriptional regulator [Victivallales bacterium]|nr:TetR/AcrR family transcriptional regulator [Victivallales bacterium]
MSTKDKILLEASREFAEKGFAGARIRDICQIAGVNLASVNYHFSSKEALYKEVFAFLMKSDEEFIKPLGGKWNGDMAQWKSDLKKWMEQILFDISSNDPLKKYKCMIFAREFLAPSGIFSDIFDKNMRHRLESLAEHIRKVLPEETSQDEVYIEAFSVISECVFYLHAKTIVNARFPSRDFTSENLKRIVEHSVEKTYSWILKRKRERGKQNTRKLK